MDGKLGPAFRVRLGAHGLVKKLLSDLFGLYWTFFLRTAFDVQSARSLSQAVLTPRLLPSLCRRRLLSQRSSLETLEDIEENAPLRR